MNNHPVYHFETVLACKEQDAEVPDHVLPSQEDIVKAHEDYEAQVLAQLQKAMKAKQTVTL